MYVLGTTNSLSGTFQSKKALGSAKGEREPMFYTTNALSFLYPRGKGTKCKKKKKKKGKFSLELFVATSSPLDSTATPATPSNDGEKSTTAEKAATVMAPAQKDDAADKREMPPPPVAEGGNAKHAPDATSDAAAGSPKEAIQNTSAPMTFTKPNPDGEASASDPSAKSFAPSFLAKPEPASEFSPPPPLLPSPDKRIDNPEETNARNIVAPARDALQFAGVGSSMNGDHLIETDNSQWEMQCKELVAYVREHGNASVPQRYNQSRRLGRWVQKQRGLFKENKLPQERISELCEIGLRFPLSQKQQWDDNRDSELLFEEAAKEVGNYANQSMSSPNGAIENHKDMNEQNAAAPARDSTQLAEAESSSPESNTAELSSSSKSSNAPAATAVAWTEKERVDANGAPAANLESKEKGVKGGGAKESPQPPPEDSSDENNLEQLVGGCRKNNENDPKPAKKKVQVRSRQEQEELFPDKDCDENDHKKANSPSSSSGVEAVAAQKEMSTADEDDGGLKQLANLRRVPGLTALGGLGHKGNKVSKCMRKEREAFSLPASSAPSGETEKAAAKCLSSASAAATTASSHRFCQREILLPRSSLSRALSRLQPFPQSQWVVSQTQSSVSRTSNNSAASPSLASVPASARAECVMRISPSLVGWVIGKGGQRIKSMIAMSGAKIWIDEESMVHVSGKRSAMDSAMRMVKNVVDKAPVVASAVAAQGGTVSSAVEPVVIPSPKLEAEVSNTVSSVLLCDARSGALFIGRRGWTVNNIQAKSGANLQIDRSVEPWKIIISGKVENVRNAEQLVRDVLKSSYSNNAYVRVSPCPQAPESLGGLRVQHQCHVQVNNVQAKHGTTCPPGFNLYQHQSGLGLLPDPAPATSASILLNNNQQHSFVPPRHSNSATTVSVDPVLNPHAQEWAQNGKTQMPTQPSTLPQFGRQNKNRDQFLHSNLVGIQTHPSPHGKAPTRSMSLSITRRREQSPYLRQSPQHIHQLQVPAAQAPSNGIGGSLFTGNASQRVYGWGGIHSNNNDNNDIGDSWSQGHRAPVGNTTLQPEFHSQRSLPDSMSQQPSINAFSTHAQDNRDSLTGLSNNLFSDDSKFVDSMFESLGTSGDDGDDPLNAFGGWGFSTSEYTDTHFLQHSRLEGWVS